MEKCFFLTFAVSVFFFFQNKALCQEQMLDSGWHHVRNSDPREWSEFPVTAAQRMYALNFPAKPDTTEQTLSLRQYDVKLNWKVLLNGETLGSLVTDEKDLMAYFRIPGRILKAENSLEITCADSKADDIRIGQIVLYGKPLAAALSEAQMSIDVFDADTEERIPARITVVNGMGTLQSLSPSPSDSIGIRPGYVYTGDGSALFGLPAGRYTVYATRGFEYGMDSVQIGVNAGDVLSHRFFIKREVSTTGWVSSDTHIHTFTWSGHGDATVSERALTIAGEGIELPVITDHNIHVDIKPFAIDQQVARYFTPVIGNEVTTPVGHFNIFPLKPDQKVINHRSNNWKNLEQRLGSYGDSKAIVLNHARDIHVNFRPFDPARHLSPAGMRLDDQEFFPNAMEVLNSGSQQSNQKELMRDWFGLLNHGHFITPVGSSDSHDVSRYFVGQARTYIRCSGDDPANIDVQEAVRNFLEGSVMVSFGLLAEIEINNTYGPGELVPATDALKVTLKVSGPGWTQADRVVLYANGKKIRDENIEGGKGAGVKWTGTWNLTTPSHDIFLVALAEGPDGEKPFWPIAKPYQPVTSDWHPGILGLSGAVWIDGDKNGVRNSAKDYAERLYEQAGHNIDELIRLLASFDEPVAVQAAAILYREGTDLTGPEITNALKQASPPTKSGFQIVIDELE